MRGREINLAVLKDECPCNGCEPPERCADPNCHDTCEKFIEFDKKREEVKKKRRWS